MLRQVLIMTCLCQALQNVAVCQRNPMKHEWWLLFPQEAGFRSLMPIKQVCQGNQTEKNLKCRACHLFFPFFKSRIKDSWLAIILFSTFTSTTWRIVFHVCDEIAHHTGIWRGSLWTQISSAAIECPWAPTVPFIERPRWAVFSLLRELSDFPNLRYSF